MASDTMSSQERPCSAARMQQAYDLMMSELVPVWGRDFAVRWWHQGHTEFPAVKRLDMLLDGDFLPLINDASRYARKRPQHSVRTETGE